METFVVAETGNMRRETRGKAVPWRKVSAALVLFSFFGILPLAAADPAEILGTGRPESVRRELPRIRQAMRNDAFRWTPLMRAAAENPWPETIELLLDMGEDRDARSLDDWNALMFAAAFNPNPEVTQVLLDAGADPNGRTRDAWVAGYGFARFTGRIFQIDSLGAGLGSPDGDAAERGWTPLFFAVRFNESEEVTERLLEAGADPGLRDEYGRTVLDYAREAGTGGEAIADLLKAAP